MKSTFYLDVGDETFLEKTAIEGALSGIAEGNVPLCLEVLFVEAEEIRTLNREQRGIDKVTDVLSFPSMDGIFGVPLLEEEQGDEIDEEGRLFLGSIVICKERAKEQAEEYGHSYQRELCYLTVHGVLHCLGYDHEEETDKKIMREKEEEILSKMGVKR